MPHSCCGDSACVCTALSALQSLIVGFVTVMSLRANDLLLEKEVPALSWELYKYILLRTLQAMICCNVRLRYYPGTPILNLSHTQKKTIGKWNHIDCYTYIYTYTYIHIYIYIIYIQYKQSITLLNQFETEATN